jgi:hypothetical protein
MIMLITLLLVAVLTIAGLLFLFGFRLGGAHWQTELAKVRMEAAQAERQLHDLTREAFVAMAERLEQNRP